MNLQTQKAELIEKFKQVDDVNLFNAIKSMLDFALSKEQETSTIPKTHQKLVMDRFSIVQKDASELMDWEEAKKAL